MSRVAIAYRKDLPCTVRLNVSYAPCEHLTAQQARELARDLVFYAREVDDENVRLSGDRELLAVLEVERVKP